jgi:MFS superfamily sulfate permease-like transporter
MQRSTAFSLAAFFPSSVLLVYLAMHTTEGWQLIVVAAFLAGFIASWLRRSKLGLLASYVVTATFSLWVAWVNL